MIMQHAMNTYGGVEVKFHTYLISALDGGECQLHAPVSSPSVPTAYEVRWAPNRL